MTATSPVRGFTLIELLVVVAIIGMLSSIVLSSLTSARNRAGDSSVRSNLKSLTNLAALYQSNNAGYGSSVTAATCPTSGTSMFYADVNIRNAIAKAAMGGGGATRCATDGNSYAVSVQLKTSTDHWCVDSAGGVRQTDNASWSGVVCP